MSTIYRKALLAGAIAALVAAPMGAAADSTYGEAQTKHQLKSQMSTGSAQVQSMTPSQLRGTEVIGTNGEQIGKVKNVVRSRDDRNIHAVIAAGGFLGVGDKEITVPLDRMRYDDGKLRLSATEDELKARPAYRAEQYVELTPRDQPISEFSAFETLPEGRSMPQRGAPWDAESGGPYEAYPDAPTVSP